MRLMILSLIAFISIIALLQTNVPNKKATFIDKSQEYMQDFKLIQFVANKKHYLLQAIRWAFNKELDTSIVESPTLYLWQKGEKWELTAGKAIVKHQTISHIQDINLYNKVQLKKISADNIELNITTNNLHYNLEQEFISTDAEVTLSKPGLKISGTGVRADLKNSNVQVLHNVKTTVTLDGT